MSNDSIDNLAKTYSSDEEDAKVYQKAQSQTIIQQTRQINELRKKVEEMSQQMEQMTIENTRLKALGPGNTELNTEDAETISLVQLALIRNYAMQRELTLEEAKKGEILLKMLMTVRGKTEKKEEASIRLSDADLLAALKEM